MTAGLKISGYASRFDERDAGGDRVRRGAFAASLLSRSTSLPMLSDHQRQIGVWDRVTEDGTGLFVEGRVTDPALTRLITAGKVNGLSIGYRTRRATPREGGRDLLDLDLREISVVAFPMLGSARIDTVSEPVTERTNHRRLA
ncbi:HK97 family phage prohead protease [Algimonas porphyrae]|uniref:Peptidase U35 n=1 Tax=Algimonas porphyrae TaxID=1128113 RepID=A0ABQ5UWT5_9PROT|nr:HK97 family phage prohead protease [Algimonas porphyrae]GLQ19666.1 peptidase U35 [Algimonas porphyrae]